MACVAFKSVSLSKFHGVCDLQVCFLGVCRLLRFMACVAFKLVLPQAGAMNFGVEFVFRVVAKYPSERRRLRLAGTE